jgi:hypothetical protein
LSTDTIRLACKVFNETHTRFEPENLAWPTLDEPTLDRLRSLPVWDEAVTTERRTARFVSAYAPLVQDPEVRDAVALQGYEEGRHSRLLDFMTARYAIPAKNGDDGTNPEDLEWAFLRLGYGECLDSFFAFGLFEIAKRSGIFPLSLVSLFDGVMQEEARHILFFVNWVAHERGRRSFFRRPLFALRCAAAIIAQVWSRVRGVLGMENDHFTKSHESIEIDITPRSFLETCLAENERRLGLYDERLRRPRLVPFIARTILRFLPRSQAPIPPAEPVPLPVVVATPARKEDRPTAVAA